MGTKEILQKAVQNGFKADPSPNASKTSFGKRISSHLKKIVFAASLAGTALIVNSCTAGYMANEPAYVQYDRPARPNNLSIWIDGDWSWNNRSQQYYQKNGYWDSPRQGKTYISGYWQSTPRGKTWSKGHWHSDGNTRNRHHQNRNRY
ncbi:MAG: hypothetical protein IPJ37_22140 [Bacteroidales bacterium]|nr:hypothetical protein [Bacteroidales bacterium]